ncbi:MAG: tRNA (adenosine(37)-N6)-threonylcarbamoyltransferase complex ATPase subunit type 1 TsaE [Candidatus Omnitrophica bacterium]|nr:tRNA (adenosine(37)-N6)-threonylcarbamoyltransferase complex ATPase subunit type 1 TsaE [Candidatus Omnitrophota bacterium]
MRSIRWTSHSYEDTLALGARFAKCLKAGDIVCLFGDLGAGKTAFTKGIARGLKINPHEVHSPTFVLMSVYEGKIPVYHFDLYRIGASDLLDIGYEEFFYGKGLAVIEWSERLGALMPKDHWHVKLAHQGDDRRNITLSYQGVSLKERFDKAAKKLA